MDSIKPVEIFPSASNPVRNISVEESKLPPWLFRHKDVEDALESAETVGKEALTNTFNHIHFMDEFLYVHLRHPKFDESILLKAHPEPCLGEELVCRLFGEELNGLKLSSYELLHLVIDDGQCLILVPAEMKELEKVRFKIQLPELAYAVGQRQAKRYCSEEIETDLIQNAFLARGELMDFSPIGFRVRVRPEQHCSFQWFNSDEPVTIHLRKGSQILFSGSCRCIRQHDMQKSREVVLTPVDESINRFKNKPARNARQQLLPSPVLVFNHPLLNKRIQLEVNNISTSGFSAYEVADEGVLLQGMIIPELKIIFSGALKLECSAQVIYRYEEEEGIRLGLTILDMGVNAYSKLTQILTNAVEPNTYISSEVDMDALWEFFFDTGFIYPKKYRLIHSRRNDFKEVYRKLYQENPEIAKHFTYQRNGRIFGHISMVRAYERAWLMHHHAARSVDSKRTGFIVLKQIMHYLNDMYRLPSAKMDYVMCYFRPENKFPDRVFGGFTRSLDDPRGCSTDLFAYLSYTSLSLGGDLPEGWTLKESSPLDVWEVNRSYSHSSGGLLMDSLGLAKKDPDGESLEELYNRLGFFRNWSAYSLSYNDEVNAMLVVNQADLGINLSDLLSSIKVIVTNPDEMPWEILSKAISSLTGRYKMERVPVLFYPLEYVEAKNIPYEKQYQLWILNVQYGNEYMEYMRKKFRIGYD